MGAAVCILLGSVMNVSAAELYSDKYASTLIKNQQESLIIDVEAYKAAYDDLAKSFGDDSYAYVNHYLTVGVYEGRTKGVLFDPLIYAESYSDVKEAFGHDISSIVEHYLKFGITEKRTQGTAQGYSDIAAAEKAGVLSTNVNRDVNGSTDTVRNSSSVAGNVATVSSAGTTVSSASTTSIDYADSNSAANYNASAENSSVNESYAVAESSFLNSSNGVNDYSSSTNSNNIPASNNNVAADVNSNPVSTDNSYHHTTSIYDNDETTLLRVEYYNENGQLINYSVVTNFDNSTNSYTETIYDSNCVLERTDVYVNGSLSSSEAP